MIVHRDHLIVALALAVFILILAGVLR